MATGLLIAGRGMERRAGAYKVTTAIPSCKKGHPGKVAGSLPDRATNAIMIIRAKAGLEPALATTAVTPCPGGRAGRKRLPGPRVMQGTAFQQSIRSPFQAGTAHRVPINGQEAFSLSGRVQGAEGTRKPLLLPFIRARASMSPPWHRTANKQQPYPTAMTAGRAFPGARRWQGAAFLAGGGCRYSGKIRMIPSRTHSPTYGFSLDCLFDPWSLPRAVVFQASGVSCEG
jgi:hypothetical protein